MTPGIERAFAQTDDLLRTFRALMRLSALEGGAARHRFETVDLGEVMGRVALAYQPVAENAGKRLTIELRAGVCIRGDADLLAQLLTNLIENALAHAPGGKRIDLTLEVAGGQAVATVADDGPGIPEQGRGNVVKRFYRLDASRHTPGSGLGLALVAATTAVHGGAVRIADNAPGTRVVIMFPAGGAIG